jgi:aryl-alcohol dehydrogenase-like predicted oxidoreductase
VGLGLSSDFISMSLFFFSKGLEDRMKYQRFAPLNRDLSRLVLGTMVFNLGNLDLLDAMMDVWLSVGGNILDSAKVYGESEAAIGKWVESSGRRDELVILTKGAHHAGDRRRVTPEDIAEDVNNSLNRLQIDFIDLYMLHRDDPSVPVGPIVEALNEHKRAGRIGAFGGSNWTPERLDEANAYAAAHDLEGFTCSSPNLSLATQNEPVWHECISASDPVSRAWYERAQMPLFSWSSQAMGFFTDRYSPEIQDAGDVSRVYYNDGNWERKRRAAELGEKKGGYNANQIALAWVLHQPFPTYALFGPRTVEELKSSLTALEIDLTPEEVQWLNLNDEL